jgi:hypothetical protein
MAWVNIFQRADTYDANGNQTSDSYKYLDFTGSVTNGDSCHYYYSTTTGIALPGIAPGGISIYPNPFSTNTNIILVITEDETVDIAIYDLLGRQVKIIKAAYTSGEHQIEWTGDDEYGNQLSKGLYQVKMTAGGRTLSRKAVMMK